LLNGTSVIEKVYFPGLKQHTTHNEAVKLLANDRFGAMITFGFSGENEDIKRNRRDNFIKDVSDKIKLIPTLGDPQTILMPIEAVWGAKYPEPGMIRFSIGIENYDELEKTISKALNLVG
jgi:cystathionine beta-lyase/cystathionine gamma-synthase